jgi:hypothetical protein
LLLSFIFFCYSTPACTGESFVTPIKESARDPTPTLKPNQKKSQKKKKLYRKMAGPRLGTSGLLMVLFYMASTTAMGK